MRVRRHELTLSLGRLMHTNLTFRFVLVYTLPTEAVRRAVADVAKALRAGALTPLPVHRFGLEHIAAAHEPVERGVTGRVVVEIP